MPFRHIKENFLILELFLQGFFFSICNSGWPSQFLNERVFERPSSPSRSHISSNVIDLVLILPPFQLFPSLKHLFQQESVMMLDSLPFQCWISTGFVLQWVENRVVSFLTFIFVCETSFLRILTSSMALYMQKSSS